jgi:hypothetical protein
MFIQNTDGGGCLIQILSLLVVLGLLAVFLSGAVVGAVLGPLFGF